uniref:BTB domain-containing protein n=1 Tax=Panagrellus redivivus TaxID=6233 RepID=A0A7E4WC59_PANRE
MSDDHSDLYLSKKDSDVTLEINGTELPAHRSILSKGSEYFKAMFACPFIEAKSSTITLNETNSDAFKVVLKYIYTSSVEFECEVPIHSSSFDGIFAIFVCARYYLVDDLAKEALLFVKKNCPTPQMLNIAIEYCIDELITYSTFSIQMKAHGIVKNKVFDKLSCRALEHLLKHRLNTRESTVFKALVSWMRANPDDSALFPQMLDHIDLYLLEKKEMEVLFKPEELIDRNLCENLLTQQRKRAKEVLKLVNLDVIGGVNGIRIIEGIICWPSKSAIHIEPERRKKVVIVDLKELFLLNYFKLALRHNVSYTVSVSKDARTWECVIDRSNHTCFGWQELYFEARLVRFIRFESTSWFLTIDADMEALYSTKSVEIDPATTIIIPKQNVAPMKMVFRQNASDISGAYISGDETNGHMKHGIRHGYRSIILQLSQPYIIGSLKLLLKEESSYYIKIAATGVDSFTFVKKDWKLVFMETNASGWRTVTFKKQPRLAPRAYIVDLAEEDDNGEAEEPSEDDNTTPSIARLSAWPEATACDDSNGSTFSPPPQHIFNGRPKSEHVQITHKAFFVNSFPGSLFD